MRNGLVNLSINLEESEAEVCDGSCRAAKLYLEKASTNTVIHVCPPEIDTFEFKSTTSLSNDTNGMVITVPLTFASTYFSWQHLHEFGTV